MKFLNFYVVYKDQIRWFVLVLFFFCRFTGVSKKKVETDMAGVCKGIQKALNNERQVEFFALAKTLSSDEYAIVIECGLQRKAAKRKKDWEKQQFSPQKVEGMCHTVQINQWFRVSSLPILYIDFYYSEKFGDRLLIITLLYFYRLSSVGI